MNVSLDTDIVIHLYSSGKQGLIFDFFDEIYMHNFLYEKELKRKSAVVYRSFTSDVEAGKVKIIKNKDLVDMGIKGLFERYQRDNDSLFDMGELYAISLAKAMGLVAFISNDTKEFGPHETLVKELIRDVIPFAFYELLFLKYVGSEIDVEEMHQEFEEVTQKSMGKYPMNFRSRMLTVARRFSSRSGTKRDYDWICEYCKEKDSNYKTRMIGLKEYLSKL